jgi:hypothetical protein
MEVKKPPLLDEILTNINRDLLIAWEFVGNPLV